MGTLLTDADELTHEVGPASNWNESRYVDFWDPDSGVGGWLRLGCRPNEGHAEMSVCVNLPTGQTAFFFTRASVDGNTLTAGGESWRIETPWQRTVVRYEGEVLLLDDPWVLTDPKRAFRQEPRAHAAIELTCLARGLESVMGRDQDHIDLIFLPGQADFHYQHLIHTTGTVTIGDTTHRIDGRGGKDHSWGPRNWHAKIYLRWLICSVDDDNGFMLVRGVGPTKQTRSGFVFADGAFHVVDEAAITNSYGGPPHHELHRVEVTMRSGDHSWQATGTPRAWVPLRHRQPGADGQEALLRIVKSPTDWVFAGQPGSGMCEYHDLVVDGRPVGLDD